MNSIPREVNGKWYPVPCPMGVSLGLSFPSEESCAAFCEAHAEIQEAGFEDGVEEGLHRAEVARSEKSTA